MPLRNEAAALSRKEQILEAAAQLFANKGYYKTTTADVAKEVGVTQPYVFHFFKTKEHLYLAVLERASKRILHAFSIVDAPPDQLVETMGRAFVELLNSHRNEIMLVMMAYATPEPNVRAYASREFGTVYDQVRERFEKAGISNAEQKAGEFIGQGLLISLSETLELPQLCKWMHSDRG